jgi:hypothetical protein
MRRRFVTNGSRTGTLVARRIDTRTAVAPSMLSQGNSSSKSGEVSFFGPFLVRFSPNQIRYMPSQKRADVFTNNVLSNNSITTNSITTNATNAQSTNSAGALGRVVAVELPRR